MKTSTDYDTEVSALSTPMEVLSNGIGNLSTFGPFFVNGYFEGQNRVCFQITPKTGANKVTEFIFCAEQVGTGGATYAKLEGGKYYVLHPNPVTEIGGVSFSMDIPQWECGLD